MSSISCSWKRTALAAALVLSQTALVAPNAVLAANGAVRLAGQTVFVNQAPSGGMSVEQRAEVMQRNLDNALVAAQDRGPSSVNIVYVQGMPVVTLGGYQVATVDAENAKKAGTTPALLAQRWADSLRNILADSASVNSYVAQLTGSYQASAPPVFTAPAPNAAYTPPAGAYSPPPQGFPQQPYGDSFHRTTPGAVPGGGFPMQRGRVAYAPAGLVIPVTLNTSISTDVARPGDLIQATVSQNVLLGDAQIPAGSAVVGTVTEAKSGGWLGRSGMLSVRFNRLRTPDGVETPITAHIVGGIGKYVGVGSDSDTFRGETWKTKAGQAAIRGAVGAGTGAALGTAVGAIAGRGGSGAGRGAWSGAAIGGGLGVAQSLIMRQGKDVIIPSGLALQIQLDAPVAISAGGGPPYTGAF